MNASALCPLRGALWHLWACADYASGASACCECLRGACQADTGAARGAQVVKATVLAADADARRLRLSLVPGAAAPAGGAGAPAGGDALAGLQPGDVVEGVVRSVTLAQAGAEVCLRPQLILPLNLLMLARAMRSAEGARRRAASPTGQAAAARSVWSPCVHVCGRAGRAG